MNFSWVSLECLQSVGCAFLTVCGKKKKVGAFLCNFLDYSKFHWFWKTLTSCSPPCHSISCPRQFCDISCTGLCQIISGTKRTFPCPGLQGKVISEGERRDSSFGHLIIFCTWKSFVLHFSEWFQLLRSSFRKDGLVDRMKVATNPKCTLFLT